MRSVSSLWTAVLVGVLACALHAASATAAEPATEQNERALIAILESDAPPQEKAITCKHLAVCGGKQAVPALGKLLTDPELASWARIALEVIPDPAADAALLAALDKCEGRTKIGVINSIGVRADAGAVDALAKTLQSSDTDVASAAAVALGMIGNPAARSALEQALAGSPPAVRDAVAEGCILCAEKLLAADQAPSAAALYDRVRQAAVPKTRMLEATRGAILARKTDGIPLLVEQLQADDRSLFRLGLSTARELPGTQVTSALIAGLEKAAPRRAALLVLAIADRGDKTALPALLQTAQSGAKPVRLAAIEVLPQLGDASCVAPLLAIAAESDADLSRAAKSALEQLPGEEVDAALRQRLADSSGKVQQVVIELVGLRRLDAVPTLLNFLDDSDPQVRAAALAALGATIELDNLSALITRVVSPKHDEDAEAASKALRAACVRMPDREACAEKLVAAMDDAPVPAQCTILEVLGAMEGSTALQAIGQAAKAEDDRLQDTTTRLLGEWMSVDAAPVLLDLAQSAAEAKYRIRALRGYIRLVRQFDVPAAQRVEMCRRALAVASRTAEKQLVLQVMERYPNVDMLRLAVEAAKDPELKQAAQATSLAIAQKIGGSDDVQKLLTQIGQDPVEVEIIKAEYGAGQKFKDVTKTLQKHVRDLPLIVLPSNSYNAAFGGDPVPGVVKQLKIQYRLDGKRGEVTLPENATILLPAPR